MVLYFTGTGNSRFIAQRIADRLQDEILSINDCLKSVRTGSIETGEKLILVTPTYAWRIPRLVVDWLKEIELPGAKKIWFVMSCGSEIGRADQYNQRLCHKKQLTYMGTAQIVMPENYLALFQTPAVEEARAIVERAKPVIVETAERILREEPFDQPRYNFLDRLMSGPINLVFYPFCVKTRPFYVDNRCIGCGRCVRLCPLNNIKLQENKPVWRKNCTHCMACMSYCPTEAIEYGRNSHKRKRYYFEKL